MAMLEKLMGFGNVKDVLRNFSKFNSILMNIINFLGFII